MHIYNLNTQAGRSPQLQSLTGLVTGLQVNQGCIAQGYIAKACLRKTEPATATKSIKTQVYTKSPASTLYSILKHGDVPLFTHRLTPFLVQFSLCNSLFVYILDVWWDRRDNSGFASTEWLSESWHLTLITFPNNKHIASTASNRKHLLEANKYFPPNSMRFFCVSVMFLRSSFDKLLLNS